MTPSNPPQETPQDQSLESIPAITLRYGLAFVLVVLAILGIWQLTPANGASLFNEGSPLEWGQFGILLLTVAVFFTGSRIVPHFRQLFVILSILPLLASIREQDGSLDMLIPALGWKLPFSLVLILWIIYGIRNRTIILDQTRVFINHRSFGLMWAGFIIAVPFGQMIGHEEFLEALFEDGYQRHMKRVIEECAEAIGYLVIFIASIDWLLSARRKPSAD